MKPGERINVIRRIADTLAPQDWGEIDLVLGQFGLPTYDEWRGDTSGYVIEMIKDGADEALAELDAYLNQGDVPAAEPRPSDEIVVVGDPDSPWKTGGFRLFLTHLASERGDVGQLKTALEDHSVEAFVAHETINPGQEWENVIRSGLKTCDALAAWLTPGNWCDQEVGFAVCREVLVVPIRVGVDPYGFIGRYQGMTVRQGDKVTVVARSIFDLLVRHPQSRDDMARALVWRYENTMFYDQARANVGYLRMIPDEAWTPALKDPGTRGAGAQLPGQGGVLRQPLRSERRQRSDRGLIAQGDRGDAPAAPRPRLFGSGSRRSSPAAQKFVPLSDRRGTRARPEASRVSRARPGARPSGRPRAR